MVPLPESRILATLLCYLPDELTCSIRSSIYRAYKRVTCSCTSGGFLRPLPRSHPPSLRHALPAAVGPVMHQGIALFPWQVVERGEDIWSSSRTHWPQSNSLSQKYDLPDSYLRMQEATETPGVSWRSRLTKQKNESSVRKQQIQEAKEAGSGARPHGF